MPEFDKYAPYVWTCYAIAGAVLLGLMVWTVWRAREARRRLDAVESDTNPGGQTQCNVGLPQFLLRCLLGSSPSQRFG